MVAKPKPTKPTWANPERAAAMAGLRSSNAAQPHTPKPRKGTRGVRLQRAINDQTTAREG